MKYNNTHFGLIFPADFPLPNSFCNIIAKVLLLDPNVTAETAKQIISQTELWENINSVLKNFNLCFDENSKASPAFQPLLDDKIISSLFAQMYPLTVVMFPSEKNNLKSFCGKLVLWIDQNTFLTPEELKIISDFFDGKFHVLLAATGSVLLCEEESIEEVIRFITAYREHLPPSQITQLLGRFHKITHGNLNDFSQN